MDETMKRRLVGIAVLSLIILVVAWWLPDRDDGQKRLNPDRLPTETRVYDIHALDHPSQRGDDGAPMDGEEAPPPNIDPEFGQLDSSDTNLADATEEAAAEEAQVEIIKPAPITTAAVAPEPVAAPEPKPVAKPAPKPTPKPAPKPAPKPEPVKKAEPKPAPKPEPKPVTKAPEPVPKPAPSQALPSGGWVVQVGSYGNQENAQAMRKKLEAKGYRVIVTSSQVNGKTFHRVRVGPYPQKSDATGAGTNLEKLLGQKVSVLPNS